MPSDGRADQGGVDLGRVAGGRPRVLEGQPADAAAAAERDLGHDRPDHRARRPPGAGRGRGTARRPGGAASTASRGSWRPATASARPRRAGRPGGPRSRPTATGAKARKAEITATDIHGCHSPEPELQPARPRPTTSGAKATIGTVWRHDHERQDGPLGHAEPLHQRRQPGTDERHRPPARPRAIWNVYQAPATTAAPIVRSLPRPLGIAEPFDHGARRGAWPGRRPSAAAATPKSLPVDGLVALPEADEQQPAPSTAKPRTAREPRRLTSWLPTGSAMRGMTFSP